MWNSSSSAIPNPNAQTRFIEFSEYLHRWTTGQAAVSLRADGNFTVHSTSYTLQTKATLFTHLASLLQSGVPLAAHSLDMRTLTLVKEGLHRVAIAVNELYQSMSGPSKDFATPEFENVVTRISQTTQWIKSLEAIETAYSGCIACYVGVQDGGDSSIQYARMWPHLTTLRKIAYPSFPGSPKLLSLWVKERTQRSEDANKRARAWAHNLTTDWLNAELYGYLASQGIQVPPRRADRSLAQLTDMVLAPLIAELDQGRLPPSNQVVILGAFGRACGHLRREAHYEVSELASFEEFGNRLDLARSVQTCLVVALLTKITGEKADVYQTLMADAERRFPDHPEALECYSKMAAAWRCDAQSDAQERMRDRHLTACFVQCIRSSNPHNELQHLSFGSLECETDNPINSFKFLLNSLICGAINGPSITQKLDGLLAACNTWRQRLMLLQDASQFSSPCNWPIEAVAAAVTQYRAQFAKYGLKIAKRSMRSLPSVLCGFRTKDSDIFVECFETRYPLHKVALARFAKMENSALAPILDERRSYWPLPEGIIAELEAAPHDAPVLLRCLLNFLYSGTVPEALASAYGPQLDRIFSHLWSPPVERPWTEIPRPGPGAWFDQELLHLSDFEIRCVDGNYPFYTALLTSLPGAISRFLFLGEFAFTVAEMDMLLRVAVGNQEGIVYSGLSWKRFLRLDVVGCWLLTEPVWEAARLTVGTHAIRCLTEAEFIDAVILSNDRPDLGLTKLVSAEYDRRIQLGLLHPAGE